MKKIIFLILFLFVFAFANTALAEGGLGTSHDDLESQTGAFVEGSGLDLNTNENSLSNMIATLIQVFLGLLGIIFLSLLIYGGFLWMTAGGNEDQVSKATETIKRAIIGLAIIVFAYAITYFIFNAIPWDGMSGGPTPR